jgi:hypothetical protein
MLACQSGWSLEEEHKEGPGPKAYAESLNPNASEDGGCDGGHIGYSHALINALVQPESRAI